MNFEERDSHWENFLQGKANLSASFQKDSCCKVCLCLELLKLSSCKDSCYRPQEENELIDRLLQGILDPDTFEQINAKLKQHLANVNFIASLQDRVLEMENSVRKFSQKINCFNQPVPSSPTEKSRIDGLVRRIENYEDTLIGLRKENEELRAQLKRVMSASDDIVNLQKKGSLEIRNEFEGIRDEQNRIRSGIENLIKSVNETAASLKELKSSKEPQIDNSEMKLFKLQIMEEVKDFNEKTQALVKKIQDSGSQAENKIDETWSQIQDLKKDHENLLNWQKECKLLTRHSNHLLSAADSVYSSMNQISDFNHYLETRLDSLNKDIEMRLSEKKQDEWVHVGNYTFDEELQRFCWSCCKAVQDGRGCEKR